MTEPRVSVVTDAAPAMPSAPPDWKPFEFPGNVHLAGNRFNVFTGVKVSFVRGSGEVLAKKLCDFFASAEGRGCLYVREVVLPDGMLVFWTRRTSEEILDIHQEALVELDGIVERIKARHEKEREEAEAERTRLLEEDRRLRLLGEKCEKDHSGLISEVRAERKAARKKLKTGEAE